MNRAWAAGLPLSVALHALMAVGLLVATRPQPPEAPEPLTAEIRMAGEPVRQERVEPREGRGAEAAADRPAGDALGGSAIPRAKAQAVGTEAVAGVARPVARGGAALASADPAARRVAGVAADAAPAPRADPTAASRALDLAVDTARSVRPVAPEARSARLEDPPATAARQSDAAPERLSSGKGDPATLSARLPDSRRAPARAPDGVNLQPGPTSAEEGLAISTAGAERLAEHRPDTSAARVAEPEAGRRLAEREISARSLQAGRPDPDPALAAEQQAVPEPVEPQDPAARRLGPRAGEGTPLAPRDSAGPDIPPTAASSRGVPPSTVPSVPVGATAAAPDAARAELQAARGSRTLPRRVSDAARTASPVVVASLSGTVRQGDAGRLATRAKGGIGWSGGAETAFDSVSLATVQAFVAPDRVGDSEMHGGGVRDGIAALLSSVPCSRLQAAFVPETGALEIRGHVPDPALRRTVEARLQEMVGKAITVGNDLLHLPSPQCDILGRVASLGLPQSTDQSGDPLVVGQAAQARIERFAGGQTLSLTLQTPDYPAWVYVDFYDNAGNVLHLIPNDHVPLRRHAPESALIIGGDGEYFSSLDLTISEPFGRDIIVAYATSAPLSDDLRPIAEPAGPYLDWLRDRIAARRGRDGIRGEWVYLFVDTAAGPPGAE